ncbi:MAG: hypothetical protein WDW38_005690 [Sanguina aurantia]
MDRSHTEEITNVKLDTLIEETRRTNALLAALLKPVTVIAWCCVETQLRLSIVTDQAVRLLHDISNQLTTLSSTARTLQALYDASQQAQLAQRISSRGDLVMSLVLLYAAAKAHRTGAKLHCRRQASCWLEGLFWGTEICQWMSAPAVPAPRQWVCEVRRFSLFLLGWAVTGAWAVYTAAQLLREEQGADRAMQYSTSSGGSGSSRRSPCTVIREADILQQPSLKPVHGSFKFLTLTADFDVFSVDWLTYTKDNVLPSLIMSLVFLGVGGLMLAVTVLLTLATIAVATVGMVRAPPAIFARTSSNTNAALDYGQAVVVALNAIETTIGNITADLQQVANLGAAYISPANMTSELQCSFSFLGSVQYQTPYLQLNSLRNWYYGDGSNASGNVLGMQAAAASLKAGMVAFGASPTQAALLAAMPPLSAMPQLFTDATSASSSYLQAIQGLPASRPSSSSDATIAALATAQLRMTPARWGLQISQTTNALTAFSAPSVDTEYAAVLQQFFTLANASNTASSKLSTAGSAVVKSLTALAPAVCMAEAAQQLTSISSDLVNLDFLSFILTDLTTVTAASLTTSLSGNMAAAQGVSNTSGNVVYYDSVKAFSAQQALLGAAIGNASVIASVYRNNWGAGLRTRSGLLPGVQNLTLFAANSWGPAVAAVTQGVSSISAALDAYLADPSDATYGTLQATASNQTAAVSASANPQNASSVNGTLLAVGAAAPGIQASLSVLPNAQYLVAQLSFPAYLANGTAGLRPYLSGAQNVTSLMALLSKSTSQVTSQVETASTEGWKHKRASDSIGDKYFQRIAAHAGVLILLAVLLSVSALLNWAAGLCITSLLTAVWSVLFLAVATAFAWVLFSTNDTCSTIEASLYTHFHGSDPTLSLVVDYYLLSDGSSPIEGLVHSVFNVDVNASLSNIQASEYSFAQVLTSSYAVQPLRPNPTLNPGGFPGLQAEHTSCAWTAGLAPGPASCLNATLVSLAALVGSSVAAVRAALVQVDYAHVHPLYLAVKSGVCCTAGDAIFAEFYLWTAAGLLGVATAVASSFVLMQLDRLSRNLFCCDCGCPRETQKEAYLQTHEHKSDDAGEEEEEDDPAAEPPSELSMSRADSDWDIGPPGSREATVSIVGDSYVLFESDIGVDQPLVASRVAALRPGGAAGQPRPTIVAGQRPTDPVAAVEAHALSDPNSDAGGADRGLSVFLPGPPIPGSSRSQSRSTPGMDPSGLTNSVPQRMQNSLRHGPGPNSSNPNSSNPSQPRSSLAHSFSSDSVTPIPSPPSLTYGEGVVAHTLLPTHSQTSDPVPGHGQTNSFTSSVPPTSPTGTDSAAAAAKPEQHPISSQPAAGGATQPAAVSPQRTTSLHRHSPAQAAPAHLPRAAPPQSVQAPVQRGTAAPSGPPTPGGPSVTAPRTSHVPSPRARRSSAATTSAYQSSPLGVASVSQDEASITQAEGEPAGPGGSGAAPASGQEAGSSAGTSSQPAGAPATSGGAPGSDTRQGHAPSDLRP